MFAFAIWDARRQRLFVAVDRFGIKPLYWSYDGTQLVFGSEMSCLLASGLVARELDLDGTLRVSGAGLRPCAGARSFVASTSFSLARG